MRRFATILAVAMSSAHLASRFLVDKQHHILEANAKKEQPGTLPLGLLRPEPASQKPELVAQLDAGGSQPFGGRLSSAPPFEVSGRRLSWRPSRRALALGTWAGATLAAARVGHLAVKNLWQPSTENQVSDSIAAKAQLSAAKSALEKALEASGANEKGVLVRGFAALSAVQVAMDNTLVALKAALPEFDSPQTVPDDQHFTAMAAALLGDVEAKMANTQAAMDDAQEAFNDLLRAYDAELAGGKLVFLHDAQHFQSAVIAAIEALEEARSQWWWQVQRMEAVNEQAAKDAERDAATKAMNHIRKMIVQQVVWTRQLDQHAVATANAERIHRQATIWKKMLKLSKQVRGEMTRKKSKTFLSDI